MRPRTLLLVVPAISMLAVGLSAAMDREPVPTFTGEDLDRMFGPAPAGPSELVDKTQPEDWRWVEQFLDRQYSRIDADRQHNLRSREVDIVERRIDRPSRTYGALLWGRGYYAPWRNGAGRGDYGRGHRADRTPSVTVRPAYDRAMGLGFRDVGSHDGGSSRRGGRAK